MSTKGVKPQPGAAVTPREKPKQIADELRQRIMSVRLEEGDLLGTEAELIEQFAVSRPTLREGLRLLEAEGLVSVTRGVLGGVIVHRPDQRVTARAASLVLQSRCVELADVFDASAIIEPAAARLLASGRRRARAVRELRAVIAEQKHTLNDPGAFTAAAVEFHEQIIALTGNATLAMVCEMLHEVVARTIADVITRAQRGTLAQRRSTVRSCESLVDAIEAGDGERAQTHWTAHMARLRKSLLGERAATVIRMTDYR